MEKIIKQPSEIITYGVNFTARMPEGATLSSATVSAIFLGDGTSATGTVLLSSICTIVSSTAKFTVQSGINGGDYKITVLATLSNSNILETDILMMIRSE